MNQKSYIEFAKQDGRRNIPHLFEAAVTDIMANLSTTSEAKVVEIARQMMYKDRVKGDDSLPMDAKKDSSPQGAPEEKFIHHKCNIDIRKVEDLLDPEYLKQILRNEA